MLIAHWPLNGNLNDISGNENHLIYYNNNSKILDTSSGKIGNAKYREAVNDGIDWLGSTNDFNLQGDFTFAIWAKVTDCHDGTANGILTNHNHSDNTGAGITIKDISTTDFRISCNTGTGSARTFNTYYGTTNIYNRWAHLVYRFIKETNTFSLWVDGSKEYETTYAQYNISQKIGLFSWSLGYNNNASYRPASYLNDGRVYNHALSDKEIYELSKAKILHYTFNDFQEPTENISGGIQPVFSAWGTPAVTGTSSYVTLYNGKEAIYLNSAYGGSGGVQWRRTNNGNFISVSPSTEYTMSAIIKFNNNPSANLFYLRQYRSNGTQIQENGFYSSSYRTELSGGWYYAYRTVTLHDECVNVRIESYEYSTNEIWMYDFQFEKKDHATPYTVGERTARVMDISGFENHSDEFAGNVTTFPKYIDSSAIGSGAYDFGVTTPGSDSFIRNSNFNNPSDQITINIWLHSKDIGDYSRGFASKSDDVLGTNGWAWRTGWGDDVRFNIGGNSEVAHGAGVDNNLCMITGTYDSTTGIQRWYKNAVLQQTRNLAANPIGNSSNPLYVGYATGTGYFKGNIEDFQLYGTALTQEQITDLYQQKTSIDDQGNLFSNEMVEYSNWEEDINNINLIRNGNGEYGDNTNFSSLEWNPTEKAFEETSNWTDTKNDDFIKINGNGLNDWDVYRIECEMKCSDPLARYYFGIATYDKNKNYISALDSAVRTSKTTLAQALNNGDEWVYLTDATGWYDDGIDNADPDDIPSSGDEVAGGYNHLKTISFYPADSEYPPYTYSKQWIYVRDVDIPGNRVRLRYPHSGSTYPVGTRVANVNSGGYLYYGASNVAPDGTWKHHAADIWFRYGTEYVKLLWLLNRDSSTSRTTYIRNIKMYNITNPGQAPMFPDDITNPNQKSQFNFNEISNVGYVDSMKGYYLCREDYLDYSGNDNNVTVNSSPFIKDQSLYFDGVDDFMDTGYNGLSSNWFDPFTVMLMVKIPSSWTWESTRLTNILGRGSYGGAIGIVASATTNNVSAYLRTDDGGNSITGGSINRDQWYHLALTYDGNGHIKFYMDGVQTGSNTATYTLSGQPDSANWRLSSNIAFSGSGGGYIEMYTKHIKLFNRALTAEEIAIEADIMNSDRKMKTHEDGTLYIAGDIIEGL